MPASRGGRVAATRPVRLPRITSAANAQQLAVREPAAPRPPPPPRPLITHTSTRTGANPRGVAIAAPKPSAGTRHNAAVAQHAATRKAERGTPRGTAVDLHLPKTINDRQALRLARRTAGQSYLRAGGGRIGLPVAAIHAAPLGTIDQILSNATNQIVHLPQSTLEGVEQLGGSAVHDITHGHLSFPSTRHMLGAALHADPIYHGVTTGDWSGLEKQPVSAALDLTGIYGGVGAGVGAIARTGALGAAVRDAAALGGREAVPLAPGTGAAVTRARAYSPNVFTQLIQHATDRGRLAPARAEVAKLNHDLRHDVATFHAQHSGARVAEREQLLKDIRASKPGRGKRVESNFAPTVVAHGGAGDLHGIARRMLDQMEAEHGSLHGRELKASQQEIEHVRAALNKPNLDVAAITNVANRYAERQANLEAQQRELNIRDASEQAHEVRKQYLLRQPGFHYLGTPVRDPRLVQALRDAKDRLEAARADRQAAVKEAARTEGVLAGHSKQLADVTRRLPTHPINDSFANALLDQRQVLNEARPVARADHADRIKAAKLTEQAARRDVKDAQRALRSRKLRGTMVEDANAPALTAGALKGMRVRPVSNADLEARIANEPAPVSYVSHANPYADEARTVEQLFRSDKRRGGPLSNKADTGEAARIGAVHPGWGRLVRSQLRSLDQIHLQREMRDFMDRYGSKESWRSKGDAMHAQTQLQAHTGQKLDVVQGGDGAWRLVPHAAYVELERQLKVDRPGSLGKVLTLPNRAFRLTVLPFSAKLPVMHAVENLSRSTLREHGLAPRLLPDYLRGRAILRERPELKGTLAPGGLSHSASGAVGEDVGRAPEEMLPLRRAGHVVARTFGSLGRQIIRFQRMLERPAQVAVLGAHGRQLFQEFGHGWLAANTSVTKLAQEVARGLNDPAQALRAADDMHRAMGQYNAFTANTRLVLRAVPFGSWYTNAARLVFQVLPRDHALFDALLQDTQAVNSAAWNKEHAGIYTDLQTAMKVGPNAWLDVGKLTPIGLPNQPLATTAATLTLPWLASPAMAFLAGKGAFGQDLKGPDATTFNNPYAGGIESDTRKAQHAAENAGIESILEELGGPAAVLSRALYEKGGTFYNTDMPALHLLSGGQLGSVAVKKESLTEQPGPLAPVIGRALDRVADPFRPTTAYKKGASPSGGIQRSKIERSKILPEKIIR